MTTRLWSILSLLLVTGVAAHRASAQAGGFATSDQCLLDGTTEPSIGIQTFHCQGGNCVVGRVRSTMSPDGSGRSETTERAGSWAFTVEPTLWQIRPDGPAAGRIQEGDVLVAVNGYPITSQNGAFQLTSMATGIPLKLQVRREERLAEIELMPVQACWPLTASSGSERTPTLVLRGRGGRGGTGAGAVGGGGRARGGGGAVTAAPGGSGAGGGRGRGGGAGGDVSAGPAGGTGSGTGGTVTAAPSGTGSGGGARGGGGGGVARSGGAGGGGRRGGGARPGGAGEPGADPAGEVRQRTLTTTRPDGSVVQSREVLRSSASRITFEGAGLVLAGVALAGQEPDGTASFTFRDPPVVESVITGGIAERGGIRAGDLVIGVSNDVPLVADLPVLTNVGTISLTDQRGIAALSSAGPGRPVLLTITRNGVQRQVILQMN